MAADIDIVIGAQDKASAVINAVAAKAGGFGSSLSSVLTPGVMKLAAPLAAAAAGFLTLKAAIGGTMTAAANIDEMAKAARGMGATAGDLQAFNLAMGEIGGMDAGQAKNALQKTQEAVGKALSGDAGKIEIFDKLSLDAEALSMQGPVEQFEAIRSALGGIENTSERAAAAQQIFGKSAKDLLPVLLSNAGAFEESMAAAEALGLTVSEEGAAGVEAMNDAIGRAKAGFTGIYNQVAVAVAPLIESMATTLASWVPPIIDLASQYLPSVVDAMAALVGLGADINKSMYQLVTLDFSGAFETATNALGEQGTAAAMLLKVEAAREKAAATAAENAAKALAMKQAALVLDDESLGKEETKVSEGEKLIAQLERKLAIQQQGAEAVERQEQLATAANDAERERIASLQAQLDLNEQITAEFNKRVEAEKKRAEEQQKAAEQEQARRAELAKQLAGVQLGVTATQSRLQTRGPGQNGMERLAKLAQKQVEVLQKIFEKETPKGQPIQLAQVN